MKISNIILTLSFTFFLSFLLSSFLFYPHLLVPPFLFLFFFVFVYNIVESCHGWEGFFVAVLSGLCIDILSSGTPVGIYTLILFIFAYLVKIIQKKYVGISAFS